MHINAASSNSCWQVELASKSLQACSLVFRCEWSTVYRKAALKEREGESRGSHWKRCTMRPTCFGIPCANRRDTAKTCCRCNERSVFVGESCLPVDVKLTVSGRCWNIWNVICMLRTTALNVLLRTRTLLSEFAESALKVLQLLQSVGLKALIDNSTWCTCWSIDHSVHGPNSSPCLPSKRFGLGYIRKRRARPGTSKHFCSAARSQETDTQFVTLSPTTPNSPLDCTTTRIWTPWPQIVRRPHSNLHVNQPTCERLRLKDSF